MHPIISYDISKIVGTLNRKKANDKKLNASKFISILFPVIPSKRVDNDFLSGNPHFCTPAFLLPLKQKLISESVSLELNYTLILLVFPEELHEKAYQIHNGFASLYRISSLGHFSDFIFHMMHK